MSNCVIGLNSGTSFDGIDVGLVKFKKKSIHPVFIDGLNFPFPKNIKEKLRKIIVLNKSISLHELSDLNFSLGELFAKAALTIIQKNKLKRKNVLLIASHGQTIYHNPKKSTLQIGESSIIAEKTKIKTVSNFREADIANGGEGAPLMPFLDWVLFNKSKNIKAVLNIGGISNITIVGKNILPIAFDIGPGNALMDLVSKKYFKKDFDSEGKLANKGKVNFKLIQKAICDPYFKKHPPKSTGKEYFNELFIKKYFSSIKNKHDLMATLNYFSAKVIQKAFLDFILKKYNVDELIISGGGIKNKTLIISIMALCPGIKIVSSEKYRIPSKYKESILFALLGYTYYLGIPNNIPSCTGAKEKLILGKMCRI